MKLTLNGAKRSKTQAFRIRFLGAKVRIWSGQWHAYWRENGNGYTEEIDEAGIYSFSDAWKRTVHCGAEKKIEYHSV